MIGIARPNIGEEEKEAICKVIESGILACGTVVKEFEEKFAAYVGTAHSIATTSGTTALEVALMSLGLNKGDKVLTTAYSFIATANAIIYSGLEPVFVDIEEETFNIDINSLEKVYEKNSDIKALLIVHLFGCPCNMDRVLDFVREHRLLLIEDCAQAHGAHWNGRRVGSFGDVAAFSFYPTKNMTTGEGGMVTTNNADIAKRAKLLINHGMKERYYHEIIGYNYRMTNIAASIGIIQLKKLNDMNSKRINNAYFYIQNIKNPNIIVPKAQEGHVFHQFTVKMKDSKRDRFTKYLEEKKIGYGIFYPLTMPEQKCYEGMNFILNYTVADIVKRQVVSIPVHPGLTKEDLCYVVECVNSFR